MPRVAGRAPVKFNEEHKQHILQNHNDMTYGEMSKLLGVNETTINSFCHKNGIRCKPAKKTGGKKKEVVLALDENVKELLKIHKGSIFCKPWLGYQKDFNL